MNASESAATAADDRLPEPTGPHPVGRTSYDWTDPNRSEMYAVDPADRRELVVWIWYPTEPGAGDRAPYLPPPWAPAVAFLGLEVAGIRAHSVENAPAAESPLRFPVLVLSPSGFPPLLLAALAEELASHGYVVVGVNHTYESAVSVFADGRVVPMNPTAVAGALGPQTGSPDDVFAARAGVCVHKAADVAFVADQIAGLDADATGPFGGRLDLDRLGALGHSFGGNAALEWCRADARCRAAVNLDGAIWTEVGKVGLDRPALQVLGEHREFAVSPEDAVKAGMAPSTEWFIAEKAVTFDGWRTVDELARPGYTVRVAGASHLSFCDVPFLPHGTDAAVVAMLAATTIAPERMWRVTSDAVLAFFAKHLDGRDTGLLDGSDPAYPELEFGPGQ
jgi:Platelet-activating factor acetylhydrolase, isoform II